jgi:glutamate/tyrosine decarboxylase-like PLP-dependent enzyme
MMTTSRDDRFLAHLIGPKSENEELLLSLVSRVVRDYSHWRRNYFPDDAEVMPQQRLRELQLESDLMVHEVTQMLAGLRRSFPFYSPRYIAHQQSETTLASIVGIVAGTLYNSNNVTSESGVVTVDWEIEACNSVLRMLGFDCPPDPPRSTEEIEGYERKLKKGFAWAHVTSGGTVANIEALWVARAVAYFPLAIWDVCNREQIELEVKLPNSDSAISILAFAENDKGSDPYLLLRMKPNESIYLLGRFIAAIASQKSNSFSAHGNLSIVEQASARALSMLSKSPYSLTNGTTGAYSKFRPVILVSGAAHYSIKKAADILGVGVENVRLLAMDENFRVDINALGEQLEFVRRNREVPIAVVGVAGTTEEGAVDPIDKILSLRKRLENENSESFWLHVDAAWGGFVRSLFVDSVDCPRALIRETALRRKEYIAEIFGFENAPEIKTWLETLLKTLAEKTSVDLSIEKSKGVLSWKSTSASIDGADTDGSIVTKASIHDLDRHILAFQQENYQRFFDGLCSLFNNLVLFEFLQKEEEIKSAIGAEQIFNVSVDDKVLAIRDGMAFRMPIDIDESAPKELILSWPSIEVGRAFQAIEKADSITVDPHKMGYGAYPCGVIAFRNDRVRHFIKHDAPYITTSKGGSQEQLIHKPPRHIRDHATSFSEANIATMAFAPFTLEGSRPSSAACALWLMSRTLPFDRQHHGTIVRSSLFGARELYEWIVHWNKYVDARREDCTYFLHSFTPSAPDTNIVIFAIRPKAFDSIEAYNSLASLIYSRFSIQVEQGQRDHSYSQPFFLSNTTFEVSSYPISTMKNFLERCKFRNAEEDYKMHGLVVLRATVMSPYLHQLRKDGRQNLLLKFMQELHVAAMDAVTELSRLRKSVV